MILQLQGQSEPEDNLYGGFRGQLARESATIWFLSLTLPLIGQGSGTRF